MTLRKLFGLFGLLFVVTQFFILGLSLTGFYTSAKSKFAGLKSENLNHTFELHRSQLIGNILLNDRQLAVELLQKIALEQDLSVQLRGPFELTAGPVNEPGQETLSQTYPLTYAGEQLGSLTLQLPLGFSFTSFSREVYGIVLAQALFVLFAFFTLKYLLKTRLIQPIGQLTQHFLARDSLPIHLSEGSPTELKLLNKNYNLMQEQARANQKTLIQHERDRVLVQIASQVSHDIRSPLAALDTAYSMLEDVTESQRVLIRMATARIRDIANELLSRSTLAKITTANVPSIKSPLIATPQLIGSLIDTIVSEKRLQYHISAPSIEIVSDSLAKSYGLFAQVSTCEFGRVISNLLNNAIEALPGKGRIEVSVRAPGKDWVEITIRDNGRGISPDILARLGSERFSNGKPHGNGLGIPYTMENIRTWGGSLRFESEVGRGTSVTIRIPRSLPPSWFSAAIQLSRGSEVIVLDDDPSIHQVWEERLAPWILKQGLKIHHFSSARELATWNLGRDMSNATYLFDYELLPDRGKTGLNLMEELKVGPRALLVTSYFDDPEIQSRVIACGAKLLPKTVAAFIPIAVS